MKAEPQVKSIATLARGLAVLAHLQAREAIGLHELNRITGIPKASLLRILKTLRDAGHVARRLVDDAWIARPRPRDARCEAAARLMIAAEPALRALARRTPFVSDLAFHDADGVRIIESNRPIAKLRMATGVVGYRPAMLWSAMGRACLVFSPPDERQHILRRLARSTKSDDRAATRTRWVDELIATTRSQGYAVRDPRNIGPDAEEGTNAVAIAVPILHGDRVAGCISIVWPRDAFKQKQIVDQYLQPLQSAARDIEARLAAATLGTAGAR